MKNITGLIILVSIALSGCSTMNGSLHIAVKKSDFEKVKYEVDSNKVDVNSKGFGNFTPLMYAKTTDIAQYLIDKGADINAQNAQGTTALMMAVSSADKSDVAKLLIAKGADVNLKNDKGETALFNAYVLAGKYNGNQAGVDLLLENNIDTSIKSESGKTAKQTIVTQLDGNKIIMPLRINDIKQVKPSSGVLQYSYKNTHIKDDTSKYPNDLVWTSVVIKNMDTNIWYKFNWRRGQVSLPAGKYQLSRINGELFNSKQKLKHVKFVVDSERLYLNYFSADALDKASFEIMDSETTCINVTSETKKVDNSNFLITAVVFGFSNYRFETGCNNVDGLLSSESTRSHKLIQYGFDNSINFDYVKLTENAESNIFYLADSLSLDFITTVGEDTDGLRAIPNLNNDVIDDLLDDLKENHLISQSEFFNKYLLKRPENFVN